MATRRSGAEPQKVQSVEIGITVLKALARLRAPVQLSQLAQATQMAPGKLHRYLQALISGGLADQDALTGRYRLGPETIQLGLAALAGVDVVGAAAPVLTDLRDRVNETCFLAIWANGGPTVVRVEGSLRSVTVVTRLGSVLPILGSATGLVFGAFLPASETDALIAAELKGNLGPDVQRRLQSVKDERIATIKGLVLEGISAVAVPVFDSIGQLAAVLTSLGPTTGFDASVHGPIATVAREAAARISARLGAASTPVACLASRPSGRPDRIPNRRGRRG